MAAELGRAGDTSEESEADEGLKDAEFDDAGAEGEQERRKRKEGVGGRHEAANEGEPAFGGT
jgi:hypothetical protein